MNISAAERRTEGITDGAVDGVTAALQTEADADAADADCDGMAVFTNTFFTACQVKDLEGWSRDPAPYIV